MREATEILADVLPWWHGIIDISDGELRDDNGFFSCNLSSAWDEAEKLNVNKNTEYDFMLWAIYGCLHKRARENFLNKIYTVSIDEIVQENIMEQYLKDLSEA